jgi:hypothetical protein
MATRVNISNSTFIAAMQTQTVRDALRKKAEQKQVRAEAIAAAEGVELDPEVVDGTRPKGRPYSRVQSRNVAQEWGNNKVKRRRILGRAAES